LRDRNEPISLGIIHISHEIHQAWARGMFWEGILDKPRGSFRGEHNGTPIFEVVEITAINNGI